MGAVSHPPPNRGPVILSFGIASCALLVLSLGLLSVPVGMVAWAMGRTDRGRMASGHLSRDGAGLVTAGYVCGMVGAWLGTVLLAAFLGIACLKVGVGLLLVRAGVFNDPVERILHQPPQEE